VLEEVKISDCIERYIHALLSVALRPSAKVSFKEFVETFIGFTMQKELR